jgi:hypothetical protein
MNRIAVESDTLATIGYDVGCGILELEFRSGAIYQFFGVPYSVYEALLTAPSKGRYFNGAIRVCFPHWRVANHVRGEA